MIKKIIKILIPNFILKIYSNFTLNRNRNKFSKMSTKQVFKEIYEKQLWSSDQAKKKFKYYSGIGSHHKDFSDIYIKEVSEFLVSLKQKPNIVDLGCGDFEIGSRIRKLCNNYVGVDIFDDLINYNKIKFKHLNVDFRVLDITSDQLPEGDICFLRYVLQHLSNDLIKKFIKLIDKKYKYLIITEHLPDKSFEANIDVPTSSFIRLDKNSGVVLTEDPFNLPIIKEFELCNITTETITIKNYDGVANTKVLQLR